MAGIVLLILIGGIFCPPQITIIHTDDEPLLINLNVCRSLNPSLSVDSDMPSLVPEVSATLLTFQSNFSFLKRDSEIYKFLSVKDLLKPPCV